MHHVSPGSSPQHGAPAGTAATGAAPTAVAASIKVTHSPGNISPADVFLVVQVLHMNPSVSTSLLSMSSYPGP